METKCIRIVSHGLDRRYECLTEEECIKVILEEYECFPEIDINKFMKNHVAIYGFTSKEMQNIYKKCLKLIEE